MIRPLLATIAFLLLSFSSQAQDMMASHKQDDRVMFDVAAEDWVTTKTARVMIGVEAAVKGDNAGNMRAEMLKAVGEIAKADWRLTSFNRGQDQTGLERWSASFEARLPETDLSGLADDAKKHSKAGMQLTVNMIDFSPTLDEREAVRSSLRTQLYKNINEQLTSLNASLPGRNYRIAMISFGGAGGGMPMMARSKMMYAREADASLASPVMEGGGAMERSEKVTLSAQVVFAATSPDKDKTETQ